MPVEMVWHMIRRQPDYHALKKWAHLLYDTRQSVAARKKSRRGRGAPA